MRAPAATAPTDCASNSGFALRFTNPTSPQYEPDGHRFNRAEVIREAVESLSDNQLENIGMGLSDDEYFKQDLIRELAIDR